MKQEDKDLLFKDLCGRLPYGVKFRVDAPLVEEFTDVLEAVYYTDELISLDFLGDWYLDRENDFTCKPILRPLSDLTKEIEHNGERFVPMIKLLELNGKPNRDINRCKFDGSFIYETRFHYGESVLGLKNTGWCISEYIAKCVITLKNDEILRSWHFDINGLIDKGLAIDINTLEINPYK